MATQEAIFIGANRHPHVSDFYKSTNTVAFGAGCNIALWDVFDPSNKGIHTTLKGHTSEVVCVKFIQDDKCMVSSAEDFQIKIWKKEVNWKCIQTIHQNSGIINFAVSRNIIVVGSADGTISIWRKVSEQFELAKEINIEKGILPLTLAIHKMSEVCYLLVVGGTATNIYIYTIRVSDKVNCEVSAKLDGHEDWVNALAFRTDGNHDIILASASQDRYIRLWNVKINDKILKDSEMLPLLSNKKHEFNATNNLRVEISFQALIVAHDDWIFSLKWHDTRIQLLATTADTSVIVWEPDEDSGIWVCAARLGEPGFKGASTATGSPGGFWSSLWFTNNNTDYILTNGKTGSWRMWKSVDIGVTWEEELAISGHTKPVTDIAWSPSGNYLLSTSLDQTTRLYARWVLEENIRRVAHTWNEISRPQIHGYDMNCVEPITDTKFVSAGDEKVLRLFEEPKTVAYLLEKFCDVNTDGSTLFRETAVLPALGLSNKATTQSIENILDHENTDIEGNDENKNISYDVVSRLSTPPLEHQLQRHTLWPEIEKLYGHGYEISCLDVSPDRKLVASACKSNNLHNAVIRIFNVDTCLELKPPLEFHNLTVTRLKFSKDNKFLLSTSRDRMWAVWSVNEDNKFELAYKNEKPHNRIIWDCSWVPLEFGNGFITASRDRTLKLWMYSKDSDTYVLENSIKCTQSITAVCVHDCMFDGKLLIAIGLESGSISIYKYLKEFTKVIELDYLATPGDKINRIRWNMNACNQKLLLGVGSADCSVRIYSFDISKL